jgi:death-on-curing family protein
MKNNEKEQNALVLYKTKDGKAAFEVHLERETVWLKQAQIAGLFSVDRSVITKHLNNIFSSGELSEKSNVQKMHIPFSDKPAKIYSLDVVLSVGYRVNSKRATEFRVWATNVLKKYLLQGYALNEKRLLKQSREKFQKLQNTVNLISEKLSVPSLEGHEKELMSIIKEYANSLSLLFKYDEGKLKIKGRTKAKYSINYEKCEEIIRDLKGRLIARKEASSLFGNENGDKLKGILGSIEQTFDVHELYQTVEEKAAHLLYFIIKDHPFIDGNKRIGSILFIYFLERNGFMLRRNGERKISDTALTALALLVAVSDPKEKDVMVSLIMNLIED